MAKSQYVCPTCGYEDIKPGLCPDCSMELDEVCPDCGNPKSECICEMNEDKAEKEE
jgi:predicted amidophosphoribosyltransferase